LLRGAFRTLLQTARSSSWFKNLRFLTRSHQHGTLTQCRFWLTKITSFHCLLSKTPLSAKNHECASGLRLFIAGTFRCGYCESLVIVNHCGLRE